MGSDDSNGAARATPLSAREIALGLWNTGVFLVWIVGPFLAAGTARWAAGWVHLGAVVGCVTANAVYLARFNPELRRRRRRIRPDAKVWDLWWTALFWPLMASAAVVAGLEHRAGATPLPAAAWAGGVALLAAGMALSSWAMASNPHFEGTVRIQRDVEHRVATSGPYRTIRHPGYVGLILWACAMPLLLRSIWALPCAGAAAAWVVVRTALEDATLRRELEGYAEYAARVRWRLVPRLW